jgi:CRP/FNR family transcriptional regulator, cyclic AMP receptor protein
MAPRSRSEMVEIIRGVPLFANLSKAEAREVAKLCSERTFEPDQEIFRQGEDAQLMVAILAGSARVSRDGKSITTVTAGDAIGEMSLIDGHRRSASVIALTRVEVVVIYQTTFAKLLDTNPSIARKLLLAQTARLRTADQKLAALG